MSSDRNSSTPAVIGGGGVVALGGAAAGAPAALDETPLPQHAVLLFDPDPVAANILALQLRHAGLTIHVSCDGRTATLDASRGKFSSIVVIANLADSQMRHCLQQIRRADPDAWLIVIADPTLERGRQVVRELGGDAAMEVPFAVSDLAHRLSMRARPLARSPEAPLI